MATIDAVTTLPSGPARLNAVRCGLTAAVALAALFVICWAGAAMNFTASHMFISLFTVAPAASLTALAAGICWSLVFGGLTGVLIALAFNAFAPAPPRAG